MKQKKIIVNMMSESAISVQGHGVHTAYEEMCRSLEARDDITLIRNEFTTQNDCDIIHFHTVGPRMFRKLYQKGPRKVMSAHVVPDSFVGSLIGARFWKPVATWYLRWFYNKADVVLAVSDATADELKDLNVKSPISVMYNSIDTERYQQVAKDARQRIRRQLGIDDDTFVVIGAGQVQPRKRVDLFLQAARELPDVTFVWVGGIPFGRVAADHEQMKQLMDTQLPNLRFPGMVELDEMVEYYAAADLFWLPSEQETFGLVVIEAAASGLPVLLRDIPDYDSTFGTFAHKADDVTFIAELNELSKKTKLYSTYKNHAKQLAQRFDSKSAASKLVDLYRKLLD